MAYRLSKLSRDRLEGVHLCRATGQKPFLRAVQGCVPGMIDWIKTVQGVAAIVAAVFPTMVARWNLGLPRLVFTPELASVLHRIEALEQFNRDTWLLVLDQAWSRANPPGMLWPEMDAVFGASAEENGGLPAAVRRPVVIIAAGGASWLHLFSWSAPASTHAGQC